MQFFALLLLYLQGIRNYCGSVSIHFSWFLVWLTWNILNYSILTDAFLFEIKNLLVIISMNIGAGFPPLRNWFRRCYHQTLHWAIWEGSIKNWKRFSRCTCSSCIIPHPIYFYWPMSISPVLEADFYGPLCRWRLLWGFLRCRNSLADQHQPL